MKIFITGESGTIPMAMQHIAKEKQNFEIVNSQLNNVYGIKVFKKHQSFKIRESEIDFLDKKLLFNKLDSLWKKVDVIIHSGAFVGTDFCQANPSGAIKTNAEGTKNIVDICNKYNINLVYLSTTAIFDPTDYSITKPITESTKINPQTLYGITKYTGEQIVDKLCKTQKLIVRPVFGFGNYPDDLHSALTKIIYVLYHNYFIAEPININILLDPRITKSYIRVENLANIILKLIEQNIWQEKINIGESFKKSLDWFDIFYIIKKQFSKLIIDNCFNKAININNKAINFIPSKDYLHYHNMSGSRLRSMDIDLDSMKDYIDIDTGIYMTCKSVISNITKKPYWI